MHKSSYVQLYFTIDRTQVIKILEVHNIGVVIGYTNVQSIINLFSELDTHFYLFRHSFNIYNRK